MNNREYKNSTYARNKVLTVVGLVFAWFALTPQITFAYLSPSTLSLILASSGGIFVAFAAGVFAYGFLMLRWFRQHKAITVVIAVTPILVLGWFSIDAYGNYKELKSINSFDESVVYEGTNWDEFAVAYSENNPAFEVDAFVKNNRLSITNMKKLTPHISIEEARDNEYTMLGTYCNPVALSDSQTSCLIGHYVMHDPTNEEAIHEAMEELGISKSDPLLLFCDSGVRSSIASLVLDYYGYDVRGRTNIRDNTSRGILESFSLFGQGRDQEQETIIREFHQDLGESIVFVPDRLYTTLKHHEMLRGLANSGKLDILLLESKHYRDDPEVRHDPIHLPIARFYDEANGEVGTESLYDIKNALNDKEVICTTTLNCLTTRLYLENIGLPPEELYCIHCEDEVKKI
ncbi:MAG: hypothetical protein U5L75_00105 [Candidatus Campbellbacteria bacterium]|nr:hypothetical protein [Candidatus Campbellbacteria bacterium]